MLPRSNAAWPRGAQRAAQLVPDLMRANHFRRAAEELHLAQPSLSAQIAALESELGTPLFDRIGRRVRLTAAGEDLLPHARRIQDAVDEARRAVAAHGGLEGGRVRVGAPPTVGTHLLPATLALFHARCPGPEILLREEGTGELLTLVDHGELDLAVVILPVVSPALEVTPLLEEDIVVAVGAQHRLAGATAVAMADLADEPFLLLGEGYELRRTTLDACRAAGFRPYVAVYNDPCKNGPFASGEGKSAILGVWTSAFL